LGKARRKKARLARRLSRLRPSPESRRAVNRQAGQLVG
jgi:hypothetical protein